MPGNLELALLGNLEIRQDEVPVTDFKSSKALALLCYLAVTGHSHTRSALAGLLWGDMPEHNARMNLSQALTTLRRLFGEHLNITRQTVAFNRDSEYWLDVESFESAAAKEDITSLPEIVQLYRGDFLDGLYVPKAPEFEVWVLTERARLHELALQALHTLALHYAEQGEAGWEVAIDYVKRLLTLEPWQEEAHRQLMRLLALSGRRSAALVQYEKCRQILIEELGVEPAAKTTALYERIRDGALAPSSERLEMTISERGEGADQQLGSEMIFKQSDFSIKFPPQATNFVGRERELDALDELIIKRGTRLVTIVGPGGIGKTRLAIKFAERQLRPKTLGTQEEVGPPNPFPNGVFFVPLESLRSNDLILPAIAEAMDYRLDRGESQLREFLYSKRLLFVIDNFEHLLEGADILSRILQSAPDVHLLATSRERLRLHEEQVYPLEGLEYPEPALARSAADYSAGKLFLQAARRQRPDFNLGDSQVEYLAHICRIVEGMPLALELAATWTDTLPMADIAAEIKSNSDFLATEFRDMPPRHRSVRAVIDVSWERMLPEEQTMFSQLSVFRGGFSREAAKVITGATIQSLAALVGKSLLRYAKSQDRYYIHELLRQYGRDKLAEQKEQVEDLHDRHSQYYCEWLANQIMAKTLKSVGQKAVLGAMTTELGNARTAYRWALQNQRINRLMAGTAFGMYYVWRGRFQEGERTFRTFAGHLANVAKPMDASSELVRAILLNWQAFFLSELGDRMKALDLLLESQDLLDSPRLADVDTGVMRAQNLVTKTLSDWPPSIDDRLEHLAQARALYRDSRHPLGLAFALTTSARLAIVTGRLKEAGKFLDESLEIYGNFGNQLGRAVSLTRLGNLAFAQNDYDNAERLLRQSVDIAENMEDLERSAISMSYLGSTYLYSGRFKQAKMVLKKCIENFTGLGLQPRRAASLFYLGYTWLHLGEYDQAVECGQATLSLAELIDNQEVISQSIVLSAAAALANGDYAKALDEFEKVAKAQDSRLFARVLFGEDCGQVGLGAALLQLGRMDEAQTIFTTLLQQAVTTRRQDRLSYALVGFAILFAKQGNAQRAVELYSLAASQPFVGNSCWFRDAFGQDIEGASTKLTVARVEQVRVQGVQRDLWGTADELLLEF